jgi:fibronectin-binding autotransporter adhesin
LTSAEVFRIFKINSGVVKRFLFSRMSLTRGSRLSGSFSMKVLFKPSAAPGAGRSLLGFSLRSATVAAGWMVAAGSVALPTARAADVYYDVDPLTAPIDGGTANWSDSNWKATQAGTTGGSWTTNDTAIFDQIIGSPTTTTVTLGGQETATAVTFNGAGYTLTGGTLSLAGTGTSNWINVNADATIESALTHLRFRGTGEVTISGGGTIGTRAIVGDGASGLVTVRQTGGTFTANDYFMVGGNNVAASEGAYIMDAGSLTIAQGIYLGWGGAGRTGSFTQNGGTVETLNNTQGIQIGIGGGSGTYTLNGGTLISTFGTGGTPYSGSFVFGGGTFQARASTTLYAGVATSIADGATARIDTNGQTMTWGAPLTGSAATGLTKTGEGTLVLTANNAYTGTTTVSAGTLQIGSGSTGGAVTGPIVNDGSLVFNRSNDLTQSGDISGSGSLTKQGAGTLTLSGTNTYTGTTTISGGTIAINAVTSLPGWNEFGKISVASGGRLTVSNSVSDGEVDSLQANASFAAGSTFGFDTTAGSRTYAGAISGDVGVVKTGGNTLVLSGTNTYTGNTLAAAGVIQAGSSDAFGSGTVSTSGTGGSSGAISLDGFSFSNLIALGFRSAGPGAAGALQNPNTTSTSVLDGNVSIGGENYTGGNGSVTLNGVVSGGVSSNYSFFKQGSGTWTFANEANTFDGFYYLIGGTTAVTKLANLNEASSLGQPTTAGQNQVVFGFNGNGGGTLQYIGASASTSDRAFSLRGATAAASNRIDADGTNGAATLTLTGTLSAGRSGSYTAALGGDNAGVNTFSGVIANGSGTSVSLLKDGTTTWALAGANTFTGGTTLAAGTLVLDYATQDNSKLADAGVLTLGSAAVTLELAGGSHTEVVASTTLAGPATIARPSGSSVIQLGVVTAAGSGSLSLSEAGIATTSTLNTNGILGGWATVGGTDWAANATNATNGSIVAYSGYTDIDAQGSSITSDAASNIRINATGSGGAIALAAGTTDISTLLQATATPATIDTAGKTLRLGAAGGILLPTGSGSVAIGSAAGDGTLTAGGADNTAGGITVTTLDATAATINAAITNNGSGAVSLSKAGPGTLTLTGASTFTGNTAITGGTLALSGGDNRLPTGGTVTLSGGSLSTAGNAQAVAGVTVAAGGGSVTGSGVFTNSGTYSLGGGGILTVDNPLGGNLYAIGPGTVTVSGGLSSTSNRIVAGGGASVEQTAGNVSTTTYIMLGYNNGTEGPATSGNGSYTISSGSLTVGQGIYLGWTAGNSGTFIQNGGTVTTGSEQQGIQLGIAGGTGTYTLNGGTLVSNFGRNGAPYAGAFTFGGGTFRAAYPFDTNRQPGVTTSIAAGATARIDTNGQTVTWSTLLNGPAATGLVKSGSGTLNLNGNFTGDVSVTGGLLQALSATSLGTGTISATGVTTNSGAIDLNGYSFSNPIVIGSRSAGPGAAGALQNTNTTSTSVLDGTVSIGGENYVGGNGSVTLNGVVSGGLDNVYSLYKQGSGTWTFANEANTFDGFYYLIGGTTAVTKLANLNEASSLGQPTTAGMNQVRFGINGGGGGAIQFIGSSASTSDRVFLLQGATTAASNRIDADGTSAAATLTLTGSLSANRSGGYTAALGGANAGLNTYSGVISNGSGTVGLLKDGTTTWALSGTNTYTGTTAVDAGTLLIDGDNSAASGNVTVAAGATLGGTGTVGGATTISGTHSPGASPGLQTFTSGLSYDSTSTLVWELSANTALTPDRGTLYDGIDLTTAGALAIDPLATLDLVFNQPLADSTPSVVDWNDGFWGSDQQWVIADVSSPVTWDGTVFGTLNVGLDSLGASLVSVRPNAAFSLANSGGDLVLNYAAVPEPGTLAVAGLAAAAMLTLQCRRRRRNQC